MNSLNIITARVSPSSSPTQSRSNSVSSLGTDLASDEKALEPSEDAADGHGHGADALSNGSPNDPAHCEDEKAAVNEETPLLDETKDGGNRRASWWHALPQSFVSSIISSVRWILATLASPGVYLIACFYDERGTFAPMTQLKKLFGVRKGGLDSYAAAEGRSSAPGPSHGWGYRSIAPRPSSSGSSASGASSESEGDEPKGAKSGHGRSKSLIPAEELGRARRSIRIKLHSDEALRQRKHRRTQSAVARTKASEEELSAQLKSPTSPIAALTKYPKTPAPPRPLIPRRQPSYLNIEAPLKQQKTLILDLDETLIHSMSKGGRMSTGHMVEVRLNTASLGMGNQSGAAQHPILYWVNKRPYCDEFLRRVCKWFNLVVFTASVQEYADPVIDWLESERKFFSARYYRQHCTYRQGAYIKDLSSVEPDLSKVMILDNSPLSYLFHEGKPRRSRYNNAIPIQGWINDPTDNDLMHLVPLLEGLQYVHDVRALLALRGGEDGQHMA
ncbi:Nuclear envelope morphology protein 1 [Tolypocladium ophioglossoides CBS 100239]|uniref:Nuclear envelope morphology protein 1 n=1 Tax=Tolypocladium ophioglossoides (strain CBS 100239) TaxID=1163406 RepID=A0A0L0N309_TOLOC|nr:Nuclear envelope morphology protein 1 [Tolypocladium ophioglossoides CBS 100239]